MTVEQIDAILDSMSWNVPEYKEFFRRQALQGNLGPLLELQAKLVQAAEPRKQGMFDQYILDCIKSAIAEVFPDADLAEIETWAKLIKTDVDDDFTALQLLDSLVVDGGWSENNAALVTNRLVEMLLIKK